MRANSLKPTATNGHNYKKAIGGTLTLVVFTLLVLHYVHENLSFSFLSPENSNNVEFSVPDFYGRSKKSSSLTRCNMFSGRWVPYENGPYYTNNSRCVIKDEQNCMKYGRPDTEFMKWRWKPDECELPLFDAAEFLELVRGKSMAFLGDSVARNQLQSLGCLLGSAAQFVDMSSAQYPRSRRYFYPDHNFTLALLMTTHLVRARGINDLTMGTTQLYLDEVEKAWSTQVADFNYVIISAGHWFSRPLMYFNKGEAVGCNVCANPNMTELTRFYGYRKAFRTAFRTLLDHPTFKGKVILRTISPSHFESEDSEGAGNCVRTRPYRKEEMKLDWDMWMYYLIQVEEYLAAKREGEKRGMDFRLLDITDAMRPRADAHPNHWGHRIEDRFILYADCLHWCLPGPVDMWNELLLQILRTEGEEGLV